MRPIHKHISALLFIFCILVIGQSKSFGQGFRGGVVLGLNASQIDGDTLYGFNKAGLTVGGRLSYYTEKSWDICLEMLYSQRGSAIKLFTQNDNWINALNYLEIPIVFRLKDWYIEKEDYHKVRADAGLSYGYLFGVKSPVFGEELFKKNDISWLLGLGINFTKHIGASLRYTSSLGKVVNTETTKFHSYFLTLRTEYTF